MLLHGSDLSQPAVLSIILPYSNRLAKCRNLRVSLDRLFVASGRLHKCMQNHNTCQARDERLVSSGVSMLTSQTATLHMSTRYNPSDKRGSLPSKKAVYGCKQSYTIASLYPWYTFTAQYQLKTIKPERYDVPESIKPSVHQHNCVGPRPYCTRMTSLYKAWKALEN